MNPVEYVQTVEPLAHAYVVKGDVGTLFPLLKQVVWKRAGSVTSPDVWSELSETFTVDDARRVASFAHLRPIHDRKYILLACKSMTDEAQHALLKVVEEGVGHSTFILIVSHGAFLLPTLLSRCVLLKESLEASEHVEEAEAFISLPFHERLKISEALAKDHDREGARVLVRGLLTVARERNYGPSALRDLLEADTFLAGSGSSIKSVVGHLALTLPAP